MSYYILTKRVIKMATFGSGDRFAARSTNNISYTISGPFLKRPLADRAAAAALSTHTCLGAQVLTQDQVIWLSEQHSHFSSLAPCNEEIAEARKICALHKLEPVTV